MYNYFICTIVLVDCLATTIYNDLFRKLGQRHLRLASVIDSLRFEPIHIDNDTYQYLQTSLSIVPEIASVLMTLLST